MIGIGQACRSVSEEEPTEVSQHMPYADFRSMSKIAAYFLIGKLLFFNPLFQSWLRYTPVRATRRP